MKKTLFIRAMVVGIVILMAAPIGQSELRAAASVKKKVKKAAPALKPYQVGVATWYGEKFDGKLTAGGELFDMFALTAAHPKLPLGSLVRVTHVRSKRSVVVRINDRGPVDPRAVIDLSYAAARELGVVRQGLARVRLDVVRSPRRIRKASIEVAQAN